MLIGDAVKALKAGRELTNAAGWKNHQNTTNAIAALLGFAVLVAKHWWPDLPLSDTEIVSLAGGIAVILGMVNVYITTATSKKVGLPTSEQS